MTHRLTITPLVRTVETRADESLLDAAARAGVRLPSSCRNGTCRACLCRLVAGEVRYRVEWPGVTAEERADGLTLPCVAMALSDVTIDQPGALPVEATSARRFSRGF